MRKEEVDALVQTTTMNRKALFSKLNEGKKKNKSSSPKKKNKQAPMNVTNDDYNTLDISDED